MGNRSLEGFRHREDTYFSWLPQDVIIFHLDPYLKYEHWIGLWEEEFLPVPELVRTMELPYNIDGLMITRTGNILSLRQAVNVTRSDAEMKNGVMVSFVGGKNAFLVDYYKDELTVFTEYQDYGAHAQLIPNVTTSWLSTNPVQKESYTCDTGFTTTIYNRGATQLMPGYDRISPAVKMPIRQPFLVNLGRHQIRYNFNLHLFSFSLDGRKLYSGILPVTEYELHAGYHNGHLIIIQAPPQRPQRALIYRITRPL